MRLAIVLRTLLSGVSSYSALRPAEGIDTDDRTSSWGDAADIAIRCASASTSRAMIRPSAPEWVSAVRSISMRPASIRARGDAA